MSSWNFRVPALVLTLVLLFGMGFSGSQDDPPVGGGVLMGS
jgi:hypothetical protein